MSSKTTKDLKLKSYEQCLKQGIPHGKIYGSDFTDGYIVNRYIYPPYPWYVNMLSSNNKQRQNKKSKKIKSLQKSKFKIKRKQRLNSRKR
ncbi:unnamed protein product [Adineta steineri]|uniref:Uncharacterized protein n=1 Tax=Adineta steineri TaxID=433720 RepID=A0A815BWW1_9BILA|nr:unnamed protein product [Adineta steineri]